MFTLSSVSKSYSKVFIAGMALIFSLQLNAALTQEQKLTASDASQLASFGETVSISGDYAVVGAPQAILAGSADRFGAAYVFKFNGTSWVQTHQLISSQPAIGELFGKSVSISGTRLIVGSPNATVNGQVKTGVVYVFELDGTGDWIETVRLTTLDKNLYDFFGNSVKLDGDRFIAGAIGNDDGASGAGSAYIFDYDNVTGNWTESAKLISFQPGSLDKFGSKVDIQGDRVIVSAPNRNALVGPFDYSDVGMVAVFDKNGNNWDSTTMLFAPDLAAADFFGIDISLSGDRILVGSYKDDDGGAETGSAYVFDFDTNTTNWNTGTKITAPDAVAYDHFGTSVVLDGITAYIGAPDNDDNSENSSGSVYIYTYDGSSWVYQSILLHIDTPSDNDGFGNALDTDGSKVFIGSSKDDGAENGNFNSGAAYVFAVNLDPTAVDVAFPVDEDTNGVNFNPTDNDTDPEGDAITITSITQPANGLAYVFLNDTHIRYEPNDDYCNDGTPTEDFTYTINGGSTATISITVNCIDDLPTAVNVAFPINEDTNGVNFNPSDNDTDPEGDAITITSITQPANGLAYVFLNDTHIRYEPNDDYCNDGAPTEDFTYTINGGSQATVSITVNCVDDSPEAIADVATVNENSSDNTLPVLNNDTDIDGGPKTIESIIQPSNGTVVNNSSSLSYTPDTDYCNDDSPTDNFTYTLNGGSQTTVAITVTCVIDLPPVAVDDSATVIEDASVIYISAASNDTDVDDGPKFIESYTQSVNGSVGLYQGRLSYSPNSNYCNDGNTTDDFTYMLNGGSQATVSITVNCIDDDPEGFADTATIEEDSLATVLSVLDNDTDIDGGTKEIVSISQPSNGTVINNGSNLSYAPNADYCNTDSSKDNFTYTLNGDKQPTVAVSIRVNCVDDNPEAVLDNVNLNEDSSSTALSVLNNDTDEDGGSKTIISISQPSNGTVVNNNSDVSYTPDANYCNDGNTTDDFTYTLNGDSQTTVSVTVNCVNDAPSFNIIGDIDASGLLSETTQLIIPNFANNYVFGPNNESSQDILQFNISEASDTSNVVSNISINNSGDLTINFTLNSGLAIIELSLQDDGSTNNSGDDTSGLMQFNVFFSDIVFAGGFETPATLKVDDYLFDLAAKQALFEIPVYDVSSESIYYYGYMLELNFVNTNRHIKHKIQQWVSEVNRLMN